MKMIQAMRATTTARTIQAVVDMAAELPLGIVETLPYRRCASLAPFAAAVSILSAPRTREDASATGDAKLATWETCDLECSSGPRAMRLFDNGQRDAIDLTAVRIGNRDEPARAVARRLSVPLDQQTADAQRLLAGGSITRELQAFGIIDPPMAISEMETIMRHRWSFWAEPAALRQVPPQLCQRSMRYPRAIVSEGARPWSSRLPP